MSAASHPDRLPDRFRDFLARYGIAAEEFTEVELRRLGTDPAMVERILAVISSGEKSMTFSLPWLPREEGRRAPEPGRLVVLLDGENRPRLLLRLTEVRERCFGAVDADDLAREGKPMRDPDAWRELHEWVWNARLEPLGRVVSADMPVWAEYFERLDPV